MITYFQHRYKNPDGSIRWGEEYRADRMFQNVQLTTVQRKMKTVKWPDDIYSVTVRQVAEPRDYGRVASATITVPRVDLTKQEWD